MCSLDFLACSALDDFVCEQIDSAELISLSPYIPSTPLQFLVIGKLVERGKIFERHDETRVGWGLAGLKGWNLSSHFINVIVI